jgi:hypothetical protein
MKMIIGIKASKQENTNQISPGKAKAFWVMREKLLATARILWPLHCWRWAMWHRGGMRSRLAKDFIWVRETSSHVHDEGVGCDAIFVLLFAG